MFVIQKTAHPYQNYKLNQTSFVVKHVANQDYDFISQLN